MIIHDVVQFKRTQVVKRARLTRDQMMDLFCYRSNYIETALRCLSSAKPHSPGDTLSRILMAMSWSSNRDDVFRIDLYKKAQEILIENNLHAGKVVDFDQYLFP